MSSAMLIHSVERSAEAPQKAQQHVEDLLWAQALSQGETLALTRYELEIVPYVQATLRRRGHDEETIAEVQQSLRVTLLVGTGDGARVMQYQGRAPLRSWVTACAIRSASKYKLRVERTAGAADDEILNQLAGTDDPAMEQMKVAYAAIFRRSFRMAFRALAPRQRLLLRLTVNDGRTLDDLQSVFGVHPSTLSRWLDKARNDLFVETRRCMMKTLGADPFEVDSVLQLIGSRMDASLAATRANAAETITLG